MFHPNIEDEYGIQIITGWLIHLQQIESGDEHEIKTLGIEVQQQKNEDNDHVQNDIIFQVQRIGKICMIYGMHRNQQQIIYEHNLHQTF